LVFIHGKTKPKDHWSIIADFYGVQGPTKDNFYEKGKAARFLVSTIEVIGTGYTLTRALWVILIEPAWLRRDEMQAYSRVIKVGQKADTVYTCQFYMGRDSIEGGIMARQERRENLSALFFADLADKANLAQALDGDQEKEYQQPGSFAGAGDDDEVRNGTAYAYNEGFKTNTKSSSAQYYEPNFYGDYDESDWLDLQTIV
jgi:hypothetical protein